MKNVLSSPKVISLKTLHPCGTEQTVLSVHSTTDKRTPMNQYSLLPIKTKQKKQTKRKTVKTKNMFSFTQYVYLQLFDTQGPDVR